MTPTESHFIPERDREFRIYLIWKSLSRDMNSDLFQKLGVTDTTILEVADIKTQKQFAEKYGLDVGTLTDWNKEIDRGNIAPELKELDWRYWAKKTTPALAAAVLREGRKHGDAARFTAWMKYVEQAEEKTSIQIDGTTEILETLKTIAEKHA